MRYKSIYKSKKICETTLKNRGALYGFHLSRGKISKLQKRYYNAIKTIYIDTELEYVLTDVNIAVDIYIPSLNKVIEIYGDFWYMNPEKFDESYINQVSNIKAKDKWEYSKKRINILKDTDYDVQIIWESEIK